jgi:hypothetical protein
MGDRLGLAVYLLCAATSLTCAVLLLRGYFRSKARFLLWSSLCFSCMAINNAILLVDKVILPDMTGFGGIEFFVWRSSIALLGLALLLYGLVWDAE